MDVKLLMEWNPWWEKEEAIEELKGKTRLGYQDLVNSIEIKEVTIITGIRRSGKSTLMYQMIAKLLEKNIPPEQILFVNLEDKKLKEYSLEKIYSCYRENINLEKKAYVFFDEIHKKKEWELWIRKQYDLKTKCKFVISGSCSYLLKKEYSTLLTGRNLSFEVFPLSFLEFLDFKDIKVDKKKFQKGLILEKTKHKVVNNLKRFLVGGGFPEIFFKKEEYKTKVLAQYFDDILYKDIIDRYNINSQKAKDVALYLITNFTNLISLRNLRNSLGLSYDTIKDYLSYYQEAFLFFVLNHFSYSLKEQKTLPSKIYCIDNGLRNAVSFKFSRDEGRLAENLVFVELKRREKDVYYWKSGKENEVDFIVKGKDGSLTAINVFYSDESKERELKGLLKFRKEFKKTKELIILTKDVEKKEKGIKFIPLWKWLLI